MANVKNTAEKTAKKSTTKVEKKIVKKEEPIEEKENEAIMKIVEERNKKERNIRYTSDDTETIFKSFFTI